MQTLSADAHSAGRGALALTAMQGAARLVSIGFVIVATRTLVPSQFGRYSTVTAVLVLVGFISDFGTTSAATKLVAGGTSTDELLRDSLASCFVLGCLAYVAGLIGLHALGYSRVSIRDFELLGLSLPLDAVATTIMGTLDGAGMIAARSLLSFLRGSLGAVLACAALLLASSITYALVGMLAASLTTVVTAALLARHRSVWTVGLSINPVKGRSLIAAAIPFALISSLGVVSSRFDVALLAGVRSSAETAAYDVALRAIETPLLLVGALSAPTLFLFSKRLVSADLAGVQRAFVRIGEYFLVISLPLSVFAAILSKPIVAQLFGARYHQAALPFALLGAGEFLMFVTGLQGLLMVALPRMRDPVILISLLNGTGIVLQGLLILAHGSTGAAAALPGCQLITILAQARFLRPRVGFWPIPRPSLGLLLSTIVLAGTVILVRNQNLVLSVALGSLVFAGLLVVTGVVKSSDLKFLASIAQRRP